ncbi:peptidylprolyl isomerase [Marinithermus hydrothermalis]|uniref:PpiC-type peptidyl-prolyl cis-trans isomerase n=1 Tax=Marinithermus hydrothermalis (strain DSM 14884 / JCM 11576 / T1) TaxID=869210 RepID=F2NQB8_MARHT|nr:peptidylprolyl isomerase [Marinithermus hydrothermalis]AEB11645.1 PpiC-type peptidyl-prolyl cis-trans isomerase [Marinithermus hydrothermalis DSM 14884]
MKRFLMVGLLILLPFAAAQQDVVVAEVDGEPILLSELDLQFELFLRGVFGQQGVPITDELRARFAPLKAQILERLVRDRVVLQAARKAGLAASEEAVRERLMGIKEQFPDSAAFESALEASGIPSEDVLLQLMREAQTYNNYLDWLRPQLRISEPAMRLYYYLDRASFAEPEELCVSHILVRTREEAEAVLERLNAGEAFEDLANQLSIDPGSNTTGGALGCHPAGTFIEPFERAARRLEVGELTRTPVESEFGFHVIRLDGFRPARVPPFEAVRGEIEARFLDRAVRQHLDYLFERAEVRTFPDRIP